MLEGDEEGETGMPRDAILLFLLGAGQPDRATSGCMVFVTPPLSDRSAGSTWCE